MNQERKKRIAIVSSYDEECGAAFYSKRLRHYLSEFCEVEVLRLNVKLMRATNRRLIRIGHRHIRDIAEQLKKFDGVCLQYEPGLYGALPSVSCRRVWWLLGAHPNVTVTIHGFRRMHDFLPYLRQFLSRRVSIGAFARYCVTGLFSFQEGRLWRRIRKLKGVHIIAYNDDDAFYFRYVCALVNVTTYPVTYYTRADVKALQAEQSRESLMQRYRLDPALKYVGIFGFFGAYKGHLLALKALEYLPEDYHLLIVGGEHPQAQPRGISLSPYLRQLYTYINGEEVDRRRYARKTKTIYIDDALEDPFVKGIMPTQPLNERVHFIGQLNDDDMARFYKVPDYVVLPYVNTLDGQSASGPATLAMDLRVKALYSNAAVFRHMEKFFPGAMPFFGMGNYKELAEAILRYDTLCDGVAARREAALETYNPDNMVQHYLSILGFTNALSN